MSITPPPAKKQPSPSRTLARLEQPTLQSAPAPRLAVTETVEERDERIRQLIAEALDSHTPRKLLTGDEMCARYQISPPTLRKLCEEGMPHALVGDARRYDPERCDEWLFSRSSKGASQ